MEPISELKKILEKNCSWNKARLDCFVRMLFALIKVRTVNLREIAVAFNSSAQIDSRYKRIKRFFAGFTIDRDALACWMFKLFFPQQEKIYLTIDRTNWFWGKVPINILTLGICYEGIAIPLFWKLLSKTGNATAKEHKELIKKFVTIFGKGQIAGVLADREFGSKELFSWLSKERIPFYIRVKSNIQIKFFSEKTFKIGKLFEKLKRGKQTFQSQPIRILGQKLFVAAGRNEKNELLIVVTNQQPETAVPIYLRRWEIESLFQSLKGRGFRFESTHMTKADRIEKLMSLIAVGFCWAHKIGEWRALKKPITWNKHKIGGTRPQYSYFRYGFDLLRDALFHVFRMKKQLKKYIKFLFAPPENLFNQLKEAKV